MREQTIESSPTGARVGTGSRPHSRARGYSSAMSFAGRKGDMNSRVPGTPSSILSNFRRRPRQPSILQMMQADDGSSGLDDDDDDDDFLGGISPQDESTPLRRSKGKSLVSRSAGPSPFRLSLSTANRSKIQQQNDETVSQSSETDIARPVSSGEQDGQRDGSVDDVQRTSRVSGPMETLPISSPFPGTSGDAGVQSNLRGTKEPGPSDPEVRLPTATLQQRLLPQRRRRKRGNATGFDLSNDSLDSDQELGQDDDELSYLHTRGKGTPKTRTTRKHKGKGKANDGDRGGLRNVVARQGQGRKKSRTDGPRGASKPARAEAAVADMGKENQNVDSSSPLSSALDSGNLESLLSSPDATAETFTSEELRLQAMKFAEIDQWDMEFEDLTDSASG